jgi:hypothetical protein
MAMGPTRNPVPSIYDGPIVLGSDGVEIEVSSVANAGATYSAKSCRMPQPLAEAV